MSAVFNRGGKRPPRASARPGRSGRRRLVRTILQFSMLLLLLVAGARYVRQAGGPETVLDQAVGLLEDGYSWGSAVIRTVFLGGDWDADQPGEVILAPETEGEGPAARQPEQDAGRVILAPPAEGEARRPTGGDKRHAGGTKKAPAKKPEYKPRGVG